MNLIYLLDVINDSNSLCTQLKPVLRVVGFVILGIKIVVPIILIIMGMLEFAKAVTSNDADKIKAAQTALMKKAIAAVIVFLIGTIVGIIMNLVGGNEYRDCIECLNNPGTCETKTDI